MTGNSCGRTRSPSTASASRPSTCYRHPNESATVVQQLIRARSPPDRPSCVTGRPRDTQAPAAHTAVGVGAILLSEQGILLGRHRLGTLELPDGRVEAGECTEDAVVRELSEEIGLVTRAEDVVFLGTLVDHVAGVLRVTVGAVVHIWQGQPTMQPNESVAIGRGTHSTGSPTACSSAVLRSSPPGGPTFPSNARRRTSLSSEGAAPGQGPHTGQHSSRGRRQRYGERIQAGDAESLRRARTGH
ncbi:NUDIX domain-containing protein [Streptomyces anulatus]